MAFMGLYADLDGSLPLSSVLWTVLFWAATSNKSILPDGCGSAAYKAAISFMDHHIGTLRQSLAAVGHAEDTAILYHADQ